MIFKKTNSVLTTLYLFLFLPFASISQETTESLMTKAIQLFDNGNFAKAEPLLKNILKEKPDDFMVNYFYGACRTENNHFTNSDLEALIKANQEVSPVDINYYFGIQYHARSNWQRALKFYNKLKSTASLTDEENQKISIKIQQCYDKVNPYEEYIIEQNEEEIIPVVTETTTSEKNLITDSINSIEKPGIENEEIAVFAIAEEEVEEIEFIINSEIIYLRLLHFKTENGKSFFEEGDLKQKELKNSLLKLDDLRNKYNNAKTSDEKDLIGKDILSLENKTYSLKRESAKLLFQAKNVENEYWQNADSDEIKVFQEEINRIHENKKDEMVNIAENEFDSTVYINPDILLVNSEIPLPVEEKTEKDLIYKIQIGAYSRGLPNYVKNLYKKLSLIRKIENYTDENGVVVYTTGNLSNYDDALKMRNQVRQEGVEDARVVPYFKGKRITLKEAKELEG